MNRFDEDKFHYVYIPNKMVSLSKYCSMKFLLAFSFLMVFTASFGQQDTVLFLKGRSMPLDITSFSASGVKYSAYYKENGKKVNKPGTIEAYRVFSVSKGGERSILYRQDSLIGNFRTVEQMKSYVVGEQHAFNHYNPKPFFYGGIGLGIGVMLFDTYLPKDKAPAGGEYGLFKSPPSLIPLVTTFVYTVGLGVPSVSLKTSTVKNPLLLQDIDFQDGYTRTAKMRRVMSGLKGKAIGVLLGMGAYLILN